jgi:hypothetical protein
MEYFFGRFGKVSMLSKLGDSCLVLLTPRTPTLVQSEEICAFKLEGKDFFYPILQKKKEMK